MELTTGQVQIRTGVTGSAARMGHRLVIAVEQWSATVTMRRAKPVAVEFRASLGSLRVVSGEGGVTPLTGVDKQVILRNAAKTLDSRTHPDVQFIGEITPAEGGHEVTGELTIHGVTRPLTALVEVADGHARAQVPVVQSDFGISAYSLMFGQLKVADEVVVELDVEVPAGS